MTDVSRVVYPADANSALACLRACYGDLGAIWNIVSAKSATNVQFSAEQAQELVENGAICVRGHCESDSSVGCCWCLSAGTGAYC